MVYFLNTLLTEKHKFKNYPSRQDVFFMRMTRDKMLMSSSRQMGYKHLMRMDDSYRKSISQSFGAN